MFQVFTSWATIIIYSTCKHWVLQSDETACDPRSRGWADFLLSPVKSKSAFQFHHQRSIGMKYATQSPPKRKVTVIVFKAAANKRHFSQRTDLLIMNGKLPSLLFIKCSVTADERLVLKANGICHRMSEEGGGYTEIQNKRQEDRQGQTAWDKKVREWSGFFLLLSTLSHSWRMALGAGYPLHRLHLPPVQSVREQASESCRQLICVSAGESGLQ